MSHQIKPQTLPTAHQLHALSHTWRLPSKPRIASSSDGRPVCATWNLPALHLPLCAGAVVAAAGTRWRSITSRLGRHKGQRGRASLSAVADSQGWWQRRGYAAPPSETAEMPEGYDCYLGKEGQQKLDPTERLFWRIVPALDAAGGTEDEVATDGDDARGPRFALLTPPLDGQYNNVYGAAQPVLKSRLDAMVDLRVADESMPELDPKLCENPVPEPYFRTQRADQRVRSVDILSGFEPLWKSLEWEGKWFDSVSEDRDTYQGAHMDKGTDDLRYMCYSMCLPVSGSRDELVERLNKKPWPKMTLRELQFECKMFSLAVEGLEKKDIIGLLQDSVSPFDRLSHEDLMTECAYRKLDTTGNTIQLLTRVMMGVGNV